MNKQFKTVSVIGLGYIGLPTAAIIASHDVKVIGVDINQQAVDTINQGKIHIIEPDLESVVHMAVQNGSLRATTQPEPADAFLIAVPTPFKHGVNGTHEPDLRYIESAARAIAKVLTKGNLVILESTSPVGATEHLSAWLADARPDLTFPTTHGERSDIRIAYCPERVLPGRVLIELVKNDRVVGGLTSKCSEAAVEIYKIFVEGECIVTDARTAEMCKLTENSYRDVNIAFANELSIICDKLKIDVWALIKLANRHPRVNILQPGPGVGGHCIAVDPWFIVSATPDVAPLIRTAREVNDGKPDWVISKVKLALAEYLKNNPQKSAEDVTIACFGLTFKPDIDDIRESPSMAIANSLCDQHVGTLAVVEPNIRSAPVSLNRKAKWTTADDALKIADIFVWLVAHKLFKDLSIGRNFKYSVDACGISRLPAGGEVR